MKKKRVGILGATGFVGQRFLCLLANHPYFEVVLLAASKNSANKTYLEAVEGRWNLEEEIPNLYKNMIVHDVNEIDYITSQVDFVFVALNMSKEETKELELAYAKKECPVISNNSAHRMTGFVPMIIPELNFEHASIIENQRKILNTKRGFIAVKSNCSLQSYVPLLFPLRKFGIKDVVVSTYQAISGAGKTFNTWPEIIDNCIPFISGEEEKSEVEPQKIFGKIVGDEIVLDKSINITSQCVRVAASEGHMATIFVNFKTKPTKEEILATWEEFNEILANEKTYSSPEKFIKYFEEENRPQTKLDRNEGNGMTILAGRLREDKVFDYKLVGLSHNTLRGAAKGAILLAEKLYINHYFD